MPARVHWPLPKRDRPFGVVPDLLGWGGSCQTDSNWSHQGQDGVPLRRSETAPLSKSCGAVSLEDVPAGEAAFLVEVVEDRSVDVCEFLQTSHPPKSLHRPLTPSERQMRVLCPIVEPAAGFLPICRPGSCQTDSNWSHQGQDGVPLRRTEIAPLSKSCGAVSLENVPAGEAAFLVEMVEDRGVDGCEFLQTSHPPKALHRPLPSSER